MVCIGNFRYIDNLLNLCYNMINERPYVRKKVD